MLISIRGLDETRLSDTKRCDGTFVIDSYLQVHAENGVIRTSPFAAQPHTKRYAEDAFDPRAYIANPDKVLYLAYCDEQVAGQLRLCKYWNRYAYVEDIVVDAAFRRRGVGRALIEQAKHWTISNHLPGIMLETQNNNVAGCRLYERCGFILGGFDVYLYRGIDPGTEEVALYWYWEAKEVGKV